MRAAPTPTSAPPPARSPTTSRDGQAPRAHGCAGATDAAGRELSIRERTVYATIDDRWRFFAVDAEGHILRRRDGTEPQAGGAFTQGTTTLDQQTSNHHMVYADGQQVAALDEAGTIDALSHVTGFANVANGLTPKEIPGYNSASVAPRCAPALSE